MHPTLQKAKTQNVGVWNKEMFIDWEGANPKDRRPDGTSYPSCSLGRLKVFKGLGNRDEEALVGQVLIGKLGNFIIYGKGASTLWIFLDTDPLLLKSFWCSSSCYVLVLWFYCWGRWGGGEARLRFGYTGGRSSLHCTLWLHDLWFWPVLWKATQYLIQQGRTVLSRSRDDNSLTWRERFRLLGLPSVCQQLTTYLNVKRLVMLLLPQGEYLSCYF